MARRRYSNGYSSGRSTSSRYSYRRRERRGEERQIETLTFGLIIVLFVLTFMFESLRNNPTMVTVIAGAILMGSAVYQWQRRFRVNPVTWMGGAFMLIAGLLGFQGGRGVPLGIFLPILVFGVVILVSLVTGEL